MDSKGLIGLLNRGGALGVEELSDRVKGVDKFQDSIVLQLDLKILRTG